MILDRIASERGGATEAVVGLLFACILIAMAPEGARAEILPKGSALASTPYGCELPALPQVGGGYCRDFVVTCDPEIAEDPPNGQLRVSGPTGAPIATVVLLSGGEGKAFWANGFGIQAREMISEFITDMRHGCWGSCAQPEEGCYPNQDRCLIDEAFGNPVEGDLCRENLSGSYGPCQDGPDEQDYPGMDLILDDQSVAVDPLAKWDYGHPTTTAWFIRGTDDVTSAPFQQELYFDKLVDVGITPIGAGIIQPIPNEGHGTAGEAAGADKIRDNLKSSCCVNCPTP